MFLFVSAVPRLSLPVDGKRMAVIQLGNPRVDPNEHIRRWTRFKRDIVEIVTPQEGRRLMARTLEWFRSGEFDRLREVTTKAAHTLFDSSHAGNLYGTLAAGVWMLKSDTIPGEAEVTGWLRDSGFAWSLEDEMDVRDGYECLGVLLRAKTKVLVNRVEREVEVGILVGVASDEAEATRYRIRRADAGEALRRLGMKVEGESLLVANQAERVARRYAGTPFEGSWRDVLRRVPGAKPKSNPVRFPRFRSRVTEIPVSSLVRRP